MELLVMAFCSFVGVDTFAGRLGGFFRGHCLFCWPWNIVNTPTIAHFFWIGGYKVKAPLIMIFMAILIRVKGAGCNFVGPSSLDLILKASSFDHV